MDSLAISSSGPVPGLSNAQHPDVTESDSAGGTCARNVRLADFDVDLSSGRVRARRWGTDGAPLLLCVHGLSANLSAFTYLAEQVSGDDRQVVAIDLRGRGRSEVTPPGSYGLDNHADDILDIADALGADEFDLAGWSLGAMVAMRIALRDKARLRSVTLIDHAGPSNPATAVPIRSGLARLDAIVRTPEAHLHAIRGAGVIDRWSPFWDAYYTYELEQLSDGSWSPSTSRAAAEEDLYRLWRNDWNTHWRALTMPTVLVRALRPLNGAIFVPDYVVEQLHAVNPAVKVVDVQGSNHFTCIVDPATLAALKWIL